MDMCTTSYQKLRRRNAIHPVQTMHARYQTGNEVNYGSRFVERCGSVLNADRSNIACSPDCGCNDQLADFPYLFWIWSGDCSRLARKFELEGGHDALDDLCHPVGHVAIGNGYVLYAGWVYSHSACSRDCDRAHPYHPGPNTGLEPGSA